MSKVCIYYVHGTAVAEDGDHVFKGVKAGCGSICGLERGADIIELAPDEDNVYYLKNEGSGPDYGEKYLLASGNVVASGCKSQAGSIGAILSPVRSYNEYVNNIQAIKNLLGLKLDEELDKKLLRLLYIGVCGEMEGYLSSTIIALIQGVRDVFLSLRDCEASLQQPDEHKWRDALVHKITDDYQFLRIRCLGSREREIYTIMLGCEPKIPQELFEEIKWRNKMAHRVPYYSKPIYPRKEDVLSFIEHANNLVDFVDHRIAQYKEHWMDEF